MTRPCDPDPFLILSKPGTGGTPPRPVLQWTRRPPMPCILLTGFDPFDGETLNPSWQAVQALDGQELYGHRVVALNLPVVFGQSLAKLEAAIAEHQPTLVLSVGQAKGIVGLSLERVALNLDDARIPDNAGQQPIDVAIATEGPTAYLATLPLKAILKRLQAAGIPAHVSQTAGTFVCNHVFYGLCHLAQRQRGLRCGFIHIPLLPEQAVKHPGTPSMALDVVVEGLRLALITSLERDTDVKLAAGSLHG